MAESGITTPGSGITSHGIRISSVQSSRFSDQAVPFEGCEHKFRTLLDSMIRNLGTEMGSAMKKHNSLRPWRVELRWTKSHNQGLWLLDGLVPESVL